MPSSPEIRINLKWWEALLIIAAGIAGSAGSGNDGGIGLTCALVAGVAFGVWRCVRILGQLLELRQAEFFTDDDSR